MRIVVVLFLLVATAHAQSTTTGAIQGVVRDIETDEPLPGVTVSIGGQVAVTDENGAFKITELLPGSYDIAYELDAATAVHRGVNVGANDVVSLHQRMKIGEAIHVDGGDGPAIRTDDPSKLTRIGRKQIEKLPNPGPTFEDTLGAIPGTQDDGAGVAMGGSSGLENRYVLDGIDITGLTVGNVGTPVLNDFVHEIIAVAGGYNAEYGRATGGIVNIITKRGTDEFHGSIFGRLKPGLLSARAQVAPSNASSIDVTANNAYDGHLGFELGGPIVKKRAWFYIGAAPQLSRTDFTRTTKRQTDCRSPDAPGCDPAFADGAPDTDSKTGFFVTDTIDEEVRSATSRATQILGKINIAVSPENQVQLSLLTQPASSRSPALVGHSSTGRKSWGLTTDGAARWSSKFDDSKSEVEAQLAWHRSTFNTGALDSTLDEVPLQVLQGGDLSRIGMFGGESPATIAGCTDMGADDPYPLITNCPMDTTYSIGGPGGLSRDVEERRAARIGTTRRFKAFGSHELKAGMDYEDNLKTNARLYSGGALIQNAGSTVIVNRWAEIAPPGETFDHICTTPNPEGGTKTLSCRYVGGLDDPSSLVRGETINWGAYLQDSWQVRPSLVLNAGLRYEEQRLRYAEKLRNTIDPLTGNRVGMNAMTLTGNWSPRLGVIWDPSREAKSKVYASAGRYYEGIPMQINDRSFGGEVNLQQTFGACGAVDPKTGFSDGTRCLDMDPDSEQLIGSSGVLVAPGIKAQYMDEGLIGGELALPGHVVIGAVLQGRRLGRVIEDVSTDGADTYIIANPGEWSKRDEARLDQKIASTTDKVERERLERELGLYRGIRKFDKPVRDYIALELTLARRFSSGLFLSASYTHSRTEGNYPGLVSYDNGQIDPNISSQYDLIELLGNRRGRLPQDRPHYFKVDAYRDFAVGDGELTLGTRVRALSGIPKSALGAHYLYGADESMLLPRGQLGRTQFEHGIDLHVAYKRKLSGDTAAELYVDVFNLYNRQGTFRVDDTYAPQYAVATGVEQNANPISGGAVEDLVWMKTIDRSGKESATPIGRNPNFGNTAARYAPASAQLGFRVTF